MNSPRGHHHSNHIFLRRLRELGSSICHTDFQLVSDPNLTNFADKFTACQEDFRTEGKPIGVQVCYHYTSLQTFDSIRRQGLLSNAPSRRHGNFFGSGVYLANNPQAFLPYGEIGIMALHLKGTVKQMTTSYYCSHGDDDLGSDVDTFHGNKLAKTNHSTTTFPRSPYFDEYVARSSDQVLPVFTYPRAAANNAEALFELHQRVQHIVDETFNEGRRMPVRRIYPALEDIAHEFTLRSNKLPIWNMAPPPKKGDKPLFYSKTVHCRGPEQNQASSTKSCYFTVNDFKADEECSICLSSIVESGGGAGGFAAGDGDFGVRLYKCRHGFHEQCIQQALVSSNKCPNCRIPAHDKPTGSCPVGSMTTTYDATKSCNGVKGTYTICYNIPSGTRQSLCHPNPGESFSGTVRKAYLPNCMKGRDLLKRLEYAFEHGLTFAVGTSLTTGLDNTVVWTSIHHKTVRSGGPHGFPDANYFTNCNAELDALFVPKAYDLP